MEQLRHRLHLLWSRDLLAGTAVLFLAVEEGYVVVMAAQLMVAVVEYSATAVVGITEVEAVAVPI